MNLSGNTVLITGGGSGIGRGLAEALHGRGNQVIIAGRRKTVLDKVTAANPGIHSVVLDLGDPGSIAEVARRLMEEFPQLNVLVNNAGIMTMDGIEGPVDDAAVVSVVTTNLLGPIRMTSALIDHLKAQPAAAVLNVTSGLAFTPLAMTATYCATKAAVHSYTLSLRYLLKDTGVKVIEVAPPYVQTELMGEGQATDPRAMPLAEYIAETIEVLGTDVEEVLVERVKPLRNNAGPGEAPFVTKFNDLMTPGHQARDANDSGR